MEGIRLIYTAGIGVPITTGSLIKGSKDLIKGLRTGASTVVKEGGEYVIRKTAVSNLDEIRNIAKIMDDFPNLRALGNNAESLAEKLLKASDGDTQILSRLNSLPDKAIETFAKDFSQADDILAKFVSGETFHEWFEKAKNFKLGKDLNFEVHHVIPVNILNENIELQRILKKFNFDFNAVDNAIPLQKKSVKFDQAGHANHPDYDDFIKKEVSRITENNKLDDLQKYERIKKVIDRTKNKLETDVLLGNKDVNQIIKL